jgi:hypothetical protein
VAKYSFDSSAFIDPLRRHQPKDVFPKLWERIDGLIDDGSIVASDFVKTELSKKDDGILKYVKSKSGLFIPLNATQSAWMAQIMARFPKWISTTSTRNMADPFVIALAKEMGLIVVTYEGNGSETDVKIPYACRAFGVKPLHFVEFLRTIGYTDKP